MSASPGWARNRPLVAAAVGYQWFYNGANFIAFKVGGDAIHPLILAAMRFAAAAALVLPFAAFRTRSGGTTLRQLGAAAGLGLIMLAGGQALSIVGTHLLPAGVASVFGSTAPLFLALFSWAILRDPLNRQQLGGVALGFTGLGLMAAFSSRGGAFSPLGAVLTLAASASWAAGSLAATRLHLPADPVVALAAQLVAAAALLWVVVLASGVAAGFDVAGIPAKAWGALAFLVFASTLVGYAAFLAINREVSSTLANTFNYAAPVVALILSALLLGEPLQATKLIAAGVALSGVALMVRGAGQRA